MDAAGVLSYRAHALWIEKLRASIDRDPDMGFQRVSWLQALQADQALFRYVHEECQAEQPGGVRKVAGEVKQTRFEKHWVRGTLDPTVCRHLDQRHSDRNLSASSPASAVALMAASGSGHQPTQTTRSNASPPAQPSRVDKLERQLANVQRENENLKRKRSEAALNTGGGGRGRGRGGGRFGRGDGRGKGRGKGLDIPLPPRSMRRERTDQGKKFCFAYNTSEGCDRCQPGQECPNGAHLCCMCPRDANHSCIIHWTGNAHSPQS